MELDRRRFLQIAGVGIVAAIAYPLYRRRRTAPHDGDVWQPQLLAMLGPDRVHVLGSYYRAATPKENDRAVLLAALSAARTPRFPLHSRRSIDDLIRDDFVDGRTVLVNGWVLSLTEARQAALYSLSAQPAS